MKKVYTKPTATFESFMLSCNISAGCANIDGVEPHFASYKTCSITQNEWPMFLYDHICEFVPKDNDLDKFCYDIPTSAERIFGS
jgi:hypothetical protein